MSSLQLVQSELQRYLLGCDAAIERAVVGDERFPVADRLGVYSHAYHARLTEALQSSYPALLHVLCDEPFAALARDYSAIRPSQFASIRWFGGGLADVLDARATEDEVSAMVADLARWEWALASAFDGPDSQPLTIDSLGTIPVGRWPSMQFGFAGSLQRVTLHTNAVAWWRFAVQDSVQPAAAVATSREDWVIWRQGLTTSFRSMPADEARMLDSALRGLPFAELCSRLAEDMPGSDVAMRAASYIRAWCSAGWITSCESA